ncbi:MAG: hypothetical protein WC607_01515 [Candidatus Micrarchaeia archaeon]
MTRAIILFALLSACLAYAEVSSTEAAQAASTYASLDSLKSLSRPLEAGSDAYWVYYTPLTSSNKLVLAVGQFYGSVLEDEEELARVAGAVYDYETAYTTITGEGYSFDALAPAFGAIATALQRNEANLYDLEAVTQSKYPFLDYSGIQENISLLLVASDDLNVAFQEGATQQRIFEEEYSGSSLAVLINYYDSGFEGLAGFLAVYEDYLDAVATMQSQVYKSSIPSNDRTSIYDSLENLKEIGVSDIYSQFIASNPQALLATKRALRDSWVNDSVSSFSYLKTRTNALAAYAQQKPRFDYVSSGKAALENCGLGDEAAKSDGYYAELEYYKNKGTAASYAEMITILDEAVPLLNGIYADYSNCVAAPTAPASPAKAQDNSWALYAALALLAAAGAYTWWKKKQEEQNE